MSNITNDELRSKLTTYLQKSFPDDDINESVTTVMLNVMGYASKLGRDINIIEIYKELRALDSPDDMSKWFNEYILGDKINKKIQAASKYDPVKTTANPIDITMGQANKILHGNLPVDNETDYEIAIEEIRKAIFRDLREEYIRKRCKYNRDGSIDRALNIEELTKLRTEAAKLVNSNSEVRELERNNSNNKNTALILNERAVDFKYKIEVLKEGFCNKYRVTPESFDMFFQALYGDNLDLMNGGIEALRIMNDKEAFHKHILEFKDLLIYDDKTPLDKPVYISEFVKKIDKEEEEMLADSGRKTADPMAAALFDEMVDLLHKKERREMGVPVESKTVGLNKDEEAKFTKVIQRIRTRR